VRITAAVPCYNAERFIAGCIESLLDQSRPPDEILVVDDGSTDRTGQVLARLQGVRIIKLDQNMGVAHARNVLLNSASGDLIVFIDADTVADPDLLRELEACCEQGVAGVGGRAIEAAGDSLADRWRRLHACQGHGAEFKPSVDFLWGVCSSYRKKVLVEAGGFDERFRTNGEDAEIGFRLNRIGKRLAYTPDAIVHHERTDTFVSLCKMMYRWYYWGYLAMRKARGAAFRFYFKTVIKVVFRNLRIDIAQERSVRLALLSIFLSRVEHFATLRAALATRRFLKDRPS
jgi:GT2 family glycosyltransferase